MSGNENEVRRMVEIGRLHPMERDALLAKSLDQVAGLRAELTKCAATLPNSYYMDPPDGGNVTVAEQLARMAEDAAKWRAYEDRKRGLIANGFGKSPLRDPDISEVSPPL